MIIQNPLGATLLSDEALAGLIPSLSTQQELDEFEAAGIARALLWAYRSRSLRADLLTASGLCLLHKKMFEDTWNWAGHFRSRETNIGLPPETIQNNLAILLGDVKFWLEHRTYDLTEIAARFHHRLVWIHPFTNGNGRFARLATDLLMEHHKESTFSWGQEHLGRMGEKRSAYIHALKTADRDQEYSALMNFMRS